MLFRFKFIDCTVLSCVGRTRRPDNRQGAGYRVEVVYGCDHCIFLGEDFDVSFRLYCLNFLFYNISVSHGDILCR